MARLRSRNKAPSLPGIESRIIREQIGHCEDVSEYNDLVQRYAQHYVSWSHHICQLMACYGVDEADLARGVGVAYNTIANFKKKIPTKRENVIKVAMYMGLSVEETDELLTRWAKYSRLYAKNPEDAIWIYLLNKGGSQVPELMFRAYWNVYEQELAKYHAGDLGEKAAACSTQFIHREIGRYAAESCTQEAERDLTYREMVRKHIPEYANAHKKLMAYLERQMNLMFGTDGSANELFRNNAYFHAQYYDRMKELRREHKLPSRTFLIALALHMNLEADEIDQLLELAGMAPLCAKDRVDSAIVFYLEEQYCQCPSRFFNINKLRDDSDYYDLHDDSDGDHEERISAYIKRQMQELDISDPDEKRQVKKLLKML